MKFLYELELLSEVNFLTFIVCKTFLKYNTSKLEHRDGLLYFFDKTIDADRKVSGLFTGLNSVK